MTYNIFDVENYSPFFDTLSLPRNDERLFFFALSIYFNGNAPVPFLDFVCTSSRTLRTDSNHILMCV